MDQSIWTRRCRKTNYENYNGGIPIKICVIGLGYIGLPTSLFLANAGHTVIGIDTNTTIIDTLQKGQLPFEEPGLSQLFKDAHSHFTAQQTIKSADAYIIAVPTPLNKKMKSADLEAVTTAIQNITTVLQKEQLVILESTVPPGTSENLLLPLLQKTGKKPFYFAHCPERAIPGNTLYEMVQNDRIIGGWDTPSAQRAFQLYSSFVQGQIYLTNTNTAEFVKLMENTFRDINIALANEFALMAEEFHIDVWNAIELANKHPRVDILKPGPGVGGHCIAKDPLFLTEKSSHSRIVSLAREINDTMPTHVIKIVKDMLSTIKNPTITLLGLAYKGNVNDTRESPTFKIKNTAEREGITVRVYDPLIKNIPDNYTTLHEATQNVDCIILVTDHDNFKHIDPKSLPVRSKNLIDTRNILNHQRWKDAGYQVKILGNGSMNK